MPSINIESLEDYKKIISSSDRRPLIVCFYTSWSIQCQRILPQFERYSDSGNTNGVVAGKYCWIRFYKVDCDDQPEIASLNPGGPADLIPTFLIYQHGRKVDEEFGSLASGLQNLLKRNSPKLHQMVHRSPISMVHYDDVHLLRS